MACLIVGLYSQGILGAHLGSAAAYARQGMACSMLGFDSG